MLTKSLICRKTTECKSSKVAKKKIIIIIIIKDKLTLLSACEVFNSKSRVMKNQQASKLSSNFRMRDPLCKIQFRKYFALEI